MLCIAFLLIATPVNALSARIDFHVAVGGDDVVHPGDEKVITLLVENDGRLTVVPARANVTQLTQMLTMVRDLSVEIEDGASPIKIKSVNPQFVGDIPAGRVIRVNFRVEVPLNAEPGSYTIPVKLKYTTVSYDQDFSGAYFSYHKDLTDVKYVTLKIERRDYDFGVISVRSDLRTDQEGLVDVIIENTGKNDLYDSNLILNCSYPLRPNPGSISAHIGDLKSGDRAEVRFRVYVMDTAMDRTYPANLLLTFRTPSGIERVMARPVGLKVSHGASFSIFSVKSFITPPDTIPQQRRSPLSSGLSSQLPSRIQLPQQSSPVSGQGYAGLKVPSRGFVSIGIRDLSRNVSDVVAVLHFDNPLIRVENSPALGSLIKGDVKHALFYVTSSAPPGKYRGYLLLRYINELGDEEVSKKYYVEVNVSPLSPLRVESVSTENLGVGLKGSLAITVLNEMNVPVDEAVFYLISPEPSITPLSSSSYVGRIDPGESGIVRFRLSVSDEASAGIYSLYLIERYNAGDARDLVSIEEFPVVVGSKKVHFEIQSIQSNLYPDKTGEIVMSIKNAGDLRVTNAVVKLEVAPPLTVAGGSAISNMLGQSQAGMYFIGTLKPGETASAKFRVDVDKDAGYGTYPVVVRIEYYDDEGYSHISNPIITSVTVKERPLITPIMAGAIVISVSGLILAVSFIRKRLKREGQN